MQLFLILVSCFIMSCFVNGASFNKTLTTNIVAESATAARLLPHKKEKGKLKTFQRFDDDETDDSGESSDNDSGLDFIPVSPQHPLFKVFGINPEEYIVYYKYKRNQDHQFPPDAKNNEINLQEHKGNHHKPIKDHFHGKLNRPYRNTDEMDDYGLDLEEFEKSPVEMEDILPKKGLYNCQHYTYYPYPGSIFPQYYPPYYYTPYLFNFPPNPYSYNIPTWIQPQLPHHPYQFKKQPGTYKKLTGPNNESVVQYPVEHMLTRRKRSRI